MKPKIMYWLSDSNHDRVFRSFVKDDRAEQRLAIHKHINKSGFEVDDIMVYTDDKKGVIGLINRYKPDVFVQTGASTITRKHIVKHGVKHVYIPHGIWTDSPNNLTRTHTSFWSSFDMICGLPDTKKYMFYNTNPNILLPSNTLTQLDVLYGSSQIDARKNILSKHESKADKIISIFGHHQRFRESLESSHELFYKTCVKIARMAEKYNWLLCIKTKGPSNIKFLKQLGDDKGYEWAKDVIKEYSDLDDNKNVVWMQQEANQYKYLCASDVVITSSRSSVEIESMFANKPLIRLCATRNDIMEKYEHGVLDSGAAYIIKSIDDLDESIHKAIENPEYFSDAVKTFISKLGYICDGKAHERVIDNILNMLATEETNK